MFRVRLCLVVMAAIIYQQGTCAAQSLAQPMAVIPPLAQSAASQEGLIPSIAIPAGTSVLMTLRSPLHTVSARVGSGLYMETSADVIQQNRIVIPARTLVQGVVERQARPGRVKGRGQLQFHLTTLILPNHYAASIAGSLQSLPGSRLYESRNREGAIQPVDQIDKDAVTVLKSVVAGAAIGSISRGAIGAGRGALIGVAFGVGQVLFKRGDDIALPVGTQLEMVLDRSLTVPLRELAPYTQSSQVPILERAPAPAAPVQSPESPGPSKTTSSQVFPEIHLHFGLPGMRW